MGKKPQDDRLYATRCVSNDHLLAVRKSCCEKACEDAPGCGFYLEDGSTCRLFPRGQCRMRASINIAGWRCVVNANVSDPRFTGGVDLKKETIGRPMLGRKWAIQK